MTTNLEHARVRLEALIERITGEPAVCDHEEDYLVVDGRAAFYARVDGEPMPVIRVFSVVAKAVDKTAALLDAINEINTELAFLRAMWVGGQVLIEGEVLAATAQDDDFRELCRRVAMATDRFGPELVEEHGGEPFFEENKRNGYQATEPHLPGFLEG